MSTALINELKRKFKTPQAAMAALGLDSSLLNPKGTTVPKITPQSRTAMAFQAALAAHFAPKLAQDAAMPDFSKVVAGITLKNYKTSLKRTARMALDAAMPALAPGGAGATPDDVIIELLDMVGGQAAAAPQAAELDQVMPGAAPAPVVDPAVDPTAPPVDPTVDPATAPGEEGEEEDEAPTDAGKHDKLMGFLKDCGLDENALSQAAEMLKEHAAEEDDEPEHAAGEDGNPDNNYTVDEDPAIKPAVTKEAMDAALVAHGKKIVAEQRAINEAREFVAPWVGKTSLALDSVDAILRHACTARGRDVSKVKDTEGLRAVLQYTPKATARNDGTPAAGIALDSDRLTSLAEYFPSAARINIAS